MNRRIAGVNVTSLIGLALLLVVGWVFLGFIDAATVAIFVLALYYAIAGSSFNFLYGSLGVFSLGQAVFLAVGGYTAVYLGQHGVSPWISLLIAPIIAAILALPIALAAVRAGTGPVLTALITMIISEAIPPILIGIKPLGGAIGLYAAMDSEAGFWDMQWADGVVFARLLLVLNVIVIGFVMWWNQSRFGYYVRAIRDSPRASAAVGVPNGTMRIVTFMIAAMIAAPAGVVFAQYNLLATADLFLGATSLFQVIVVALAGGAARPWGALVGSIVITYIAQEASDAAGGRPGIGPLTFAVVFILMALLMPRGLSGTWDMLAKKRKGTTGGALQRVPSADAATTTSTSTTTTAGVAPPEPTPVDGRR